MARNSIVKPQRVPKTKLPFMPIHIRGSSSHNNPYCCFPHPVARTGGYKKGTSYKRVATHSVDIMGYPTPLCGLCAREWATNMKTALSDLARTSPNLHPLPD